MSDKIIYGLFIQHFYLLFPAFTEFLGIGRDFGMTVKMPTATGPARMPTASTPQGKTSLCSSLKTDHRGLILGFQDMGFNMSVNVLFV